MGWLYGFSSPQEIVDRHRAPGFYHHATLVKDSLVSGNHWMLMQSDDDPDYRWIGLNLIRKEAGPDQGYGYKGMSETAFPYYTNCPKYFLLASTEPRSDWREYCLIHQENEHMIRKAMDHHIQSGKDIVTPWNSTRFTLIEPLSARLGWKVQRVDDGGVFRMPAKQLKAVVQDLLDKDAKVQYEQGAQDHSSATPAWAKDPHSQVDQPWEHLPMGVKAWWLNRSLGGKLSAKVLAGEPIVSRLDPERHQRVLDAFKAREYAQNQQNRERMRG